MVTYPPARPVAGMSSGDLAALLDRLRPSQLRILASAFAGADPAQFDKAVAQAARITPPENFAGVGVNRL